MKAEHGYRHSKRFTFQNFHESMTHDMRSSGEVDCVHCHASNVAAYREAGLKLGAPGSLTDSLTSVNGQQQLVAEWAEVNHLTYAQATALVKHPITCLDCRDPRTLRLRITRPAFTEGVLNNDLASRQEMRSMACGQCHVEYYFKGDQKRLTFPWNNGLKVEQMEAYYDESGWTDWIHKDSGAKESTRAAECRARTATCPKSATAP